MNVIIGYLVVIGMIFGAFLLHGGAIGAILSAMPTEMMAILGGALGAFIVANQTKNLKAVARALPAALKGSRHDKARALDLLSLLYELQVKARKEGMMALEADVDAPQQSPIFNKYPVIAGDHHALGFIRDYLRIMVSGNLNAFEIENLMDVELDTHHQEGMAPIAAIQRLGDALPAFGIVAAVLGVVNTMASVGAPPAVLGGMIGSALVGTFLGILLSYGMVSPLGALLEQKLDEDSKELQCIKTVLLAGMQGYPPPSAIEFGRKVLFSSERPEFEELEQRIKSLR
ncbi:flagellar motor stator protein MotA [Chromobacterium alkanivorans]|uniref:flagellar motor stator protein MotA n=1 Tax=Chromobacterium alkanivorans TaxID=1071719 RepID=UPI0019672701|nr:flagellar motor stator protein MotA [Chromobacterium alkanivorans]MBN3003248.1 flagellar motor stator protein MotA [Chromobacterium alkanivorans]